MSSAYGRDPLAGVDRSAAPSTSRMATTSAVSRASSRPTAQVQTAQLATTSSRNDGQYCPRPGDDGAAAAADGTNDRDDCESLTPSTESWVEIDSQPSSSSVSSIADEIVVTGLRVGHSANGRSGSNLAVMPQRRRRLLQQVEAEAVAVAANRPPASASISVSVHLAPSPKRASTAVVAASRGSAESSQEEYDESESEEERLMTSSTEHVHVRHPPTPPQPFALLQQQAQTRMQQRAAASDGDDEDDKDDDDGTALGTPAAGAPTFRPQPNAFSHPPHHLQQHRSVPSPPHQQAAASYTRPSSLSQRGGSRGSRGPSGAPRFGTSTYPPNHEDNDAALRASLTTLLSCAAAARGLPKKEAGAYGEASGISSGLRSSSQPMDLRLVPESELMDDVPTGSRSHVAFQSPRLPSRLSPHGGAAQPHRSGNGNGNGSGGASRSGPRSNMRTVPSSRGSAVSAVSSSSRSKRATKKKRTSSSAYGEGTATTFLTPTMLTWVVSAGVVVLVSVVGFGAGYVLGREVGKQEAVSAGGAFGNSAASNATSSCGNEIMRSSTGSTLRRFRWGSGMTRSAVA
ncbi:hypothetical protein CMQ_1606 [Grosmannia clavigera kw1407]|uniref:Uncharacterized protein n=1 Tax=Grosmannia clavigera (strain kw1407 / UAMH 11150) TaxID=655863 RepID=F0XDB3_GROCL|nr:uncharacterized protein CMQ_1606 [Grosmannia clavigera kw1407]EFX04678.1 hypothetical protein CMQ_1606 [Grosmannia clavigera kw1407]